MSSMSSQEALDVAFHPRSVAIAGVSPDRRRWGGRTFLEGIRQLDRLKRVYAVNPKGGELEDGSPIYTNLAAIPDDVDYLISAVPASAILGLIDDAIAKKVKVIHLFTAGFSETGEEERADLESVVFDKLRDAGIRAIGPNCMGVHSAISGLTWMSDASPVAGRVGVFSQSGMNASEIVHYGERRGVRFSYVASYGNASDLNESDYLDYLANNDETDVILGYIEGVKDGPRFVQSARRAVERKPLIILKGGQTEAGSRAAHSHTGSLAGSTAIWDAVGKQTGFIGVNGIDELIDMALIVQHLPEIRGPRVAVVGRGGGGSVLAADACDRAGLELPWLSEETQRRIGEFTPLAGSSFRNPVDTPLVPSERGTGQTVQIVAEDPNIDFLMVHFGVNWGSGPNAAAGDSFSDRVLEHIRPIKGMSSKPVALVMGRPRGVPEMEIAVRLQGELSAAGYAIFPSIEACAVAARRYLDWQAGRELF